MTAFVRQSYNTEFVRRMSRDELEDELGTRKVKFDEDDSDDALRDKLMNHEAGQVCPFWEPYEP